jgi:LuxR family maltose regulon positive regulatory protein
LLQTSILDQLSGDLCDAVTIRSDSHSLLQRLYNANLFLVPLDDEQHWYRYHQLFADMLRDLQNARQLVSTPDLHQRASSWYARAVTGERGAFVSQAIQHSLMVGDYVMAVQLIESHARDMLMQWHLKTVEGWMQSIPAEWCALSPRANLAFARMHLMRGDHAQAAPYLERLGTLFSSPQAGSFDPRLVA